MSIERFNRAMPLVKNWIGRTFEAHAREMRPVADFGFARLPNFFPPQLLRQTKVVAVDNVPIPPLSQYGLPEMADFERSDPDGITYLNTYFVRNGMEKQEWLHFHELVHVIQWKHMGAEKFLLEYAMEYLKYGYRQSPLETMAYDLHECFERGVPPFDVEAEVRAKLDKMPRLI